MKELTKLILTDLDQFYSINYINKIQINGLSLIKVDSKQISLYKEKILQSEILIDAILSNHKNNIKLLDVNESEVIKSNSPSLAFHYCLSLHQKNSNLEPIILKSPKYSYLYAQFVIHKRWKEAENIILQDLNVAIKYAGIVTNGRWKELEELIIGDPKLCFNYASSVIGGRWPEGEPTIMNSNYRTDYVNDLSRNGYDTTELLKEYPK